MEYVTDMCSIEQSYGPTTVPQYPCAAVAVTYYYKVQQLRAAARSQWSEFCWAFQSPIGEIWPGLRIPTMCELGPYSCTDSSARAQITGRRLLIKAASASKPVSETGHHTEQYSSTIDRKAGRQACTADYTQSTPKRRASVHPYEYMPSTVQ